jgi:hypothetical protein
VLTKAGVILRFNGMVYLRPQEVAELVYKVCSCTWEAGFRATCFAVQQKPSLRS